MIMKVKQILVNWSMDDEELWEPYEWEDDDDLEMLSEITCLHVSEACLQDLLYGQLKMISPVDSLCVFSDGKHGVVVEFDDEQRLVYRSLLLFEYREALNTLIARLPITTLTYQILDMAEWKEYGLTRLEKEKKQFVLETLDHLYHYQKEQLAYLYHQYFIEECSIKRMYEKLADKLKEGYAPLHEMIYHDLLKYI